MARPLNAFSGEPCSRCGCVIRYKTSKRCVACNREWMRQHARTRSDREARVGDPCAICAKPMNQPCCDHDGNTGEFRGWLCHECNRGIGQFQERSSLLRAAVAYLEKTKGPEPLGPEPSSLP